MSKDGPKSVNWIDRYIQFGQESDGLLCLRFGLNQNLRVLDLFSSNLVRSISL